jgi:hypothetical protein
MTYALDATHDPALRSWVESAHAPQTDFPIQNLPYGRFRRRKVDEPWRIGVAIGDLVLDLKLAEELCPWPREVYEWLRPLAAGDLNDFMARGPRVWHAMRVALSAALAEGSDQGLFLEMCLVPQAQCEMSLPCRISEYTDFYTGIHHATAAVKLFRPDSPLLPNYKWVPSRCPTGPNLPGRGRYRDPARVLRARPLRAHRFRRVRGDGAASGLHCRQPCSADWPVTPTIGARVAHRVAALPVLGDPKP